MIKRHAYENIDYKDKFVTRSRYPKCIYHHISIIINLKQYTEYLLEVAANIKFCNRTVMHKTFTVNQEIKYL